MRLADWIRKRGRGEKVLFTLLLLLLLWRVPSKWSGREERVVVITEEVAERDIVERVPASGKIQPVTEVKVSSELSGEIIELKVVEGERVNEGDTVVKIKQELYLSMVERAEASLRSTKALYQQQELHQREAKMEYERSKGLFEEGVISQREYERSLSQYQLAKAELKAARYNVESSSATLREANENLSKSVIFAPMSGVISKVNVERGERIVGTSQMAGTELLRVADFEQMELLVEVGESDVVKIEIGDSATIDIDAYPNTQFSGVVTHISNSAKEGRRVFEQLPTFEIKVLIIRDKEENKLLLPGMSASLFIESARKSAVLAVPLQSITTREELLSDSTIQKRGRGAKVEQLFVVKEGGRVEVREVVTGVQDLYYIEVTKGVKRGERVVSGPYLAITNILTKDSYVKEEKLK